MPNAASLAVSSGSSNSERSALVFDSLKSLPVSFTAAGESSKNPQATAAANQVVEGDGSLDVEVVEAAAAWLRTKLGLTIIGFDIVVQVGTLDHVMVDVNFFPSFRDVPDVEAIPAFWSALLNAHKAKTLQTI
jgi:inositol-1,3,4-trisphosphate 5/6-kinase/inositol-tetrakisphosphate 1-kinase